MDPASEQLAGIAFGRFQVLPDRRDVLADGRPVKLGGRAFDVLMALIEARGAVAISVLASTEGQSVGLFESVKERFCSFQISGLEPPSVKRS
jgi:DNA-binding response OmpR family regulator